MFLLPQSYWRVSTTPHKGRGVFAMTDIAPGTVIGDYIGTIIHGDDDTDVNGIYGMSWSDRYSILPDISSIDVHCINASCMPNSGMYPYQGHMLFVSLRKIFPGEELTVSYMIEPGGEIFGDYHCQCKTPLCTGSMMVSQAKAKAFWDDFVRVTQGEFADAPAAPFNKVMTKLPHYPDHIEDNPVYDIYGSLGHEPIVSDVLVLPSIGQIRTFIRQHGVGMRISRIGVTVIGVKDGFCIVSPLTK